MSMSHFLFELFYTFLFSRFFTSKSIRLCYLVCQLVCVFPAGQKSTINNPLIRFFVVPFQFKIGSILLLGRVQSLFFKGFYIFFLMSFCSLLLPTTSLSTLIIVIIVVIINKLIFNTCLPLF